MEIVEQDCVIVGGGIIGLMIAHYYRQKYPQHHISILEKEPYLGEHCSGRNSSVLHAGIYYTTNSKKHLLCLEGKELWPEICQKISIPYSLCGKYIISTDHSENEQLEKIFQQAVENEVVGITRDISPTELSMLKSLTHCQQAIFSPYTGIIDIGSALNGLAKSIESSNRFILRNHHVIDCTRNALNFEITVKNSAQVLFQIKSPLLFNCAGLNSISLRKLLGLQNIRPIYGKGHYLKLLKKISAKNLIYPVPLPQLKGLGVHLTIDMSGAVKFGPNHEMVDSIDYSLPKNLIDDMYPSIQKVFRDITKDDLGPDYSGIRSRICQSNDNKPLTDFMLTTPKENGIDGLFEALGIDSPGLTSAPAIARYFMHQL